MSTTTGLDISCKNAMEFYPVEQKSKNNKLTIEEYIDFYDSDKQLHLTVTKLKQILSMHGFKSLKGLKKDMKFDVVKSINLMNPNRSTIKEDDVSSKAFLSVHEVIKDLSLLNWQECCITSIQTLNHDSIIQSPNPSLYKKSKSKANSNSTSISSKKKKSSENGTNNVYAITDSECGLIPVSTSKSSTGATSALELGEVNGDITTANDVCAVEGGSNLPTILNFASFLKPNFSKRKRDAK